MNTLIPKAFEYFHNRVDSNARSHLGSILLGNSVLVPVAHNSLQLGTWQSIFLLELDGPRTRTVLIKIVG